MIIVKVTYTVKSEFVLKNQENINSFMKDFRKLNSADFRYIAYVCGDGNTFMHLSMYKNEDIQKQVLALNRLNHFNGKGMKAGLKVLTKVEMMKLVASSFNIFN